MTCFYSQGQPQCRRKLTTTGLPSGAGRSSLEVDGTFSPTAGVVPSLRAAGDIHDQNSVCQVMVKGEQYNRGVSLHKEGDTPCSEEQGRLYCPVDGRGAALEASYAGSQIISTISLGCTS